MTWAEKGPPVQTAFPSSRCSGPDEVLSIFGNSDIGTELKQLSSAFVAFVRANATLLTEMVLNQGVNYPQSFYYSAMAIVTSQAPEIREVFTGSEDFLQILLQFPKHVTKSITCGRFCKILENYLILSESEFLSKIKNPREFLQDLFDHIRYLSIFDFLLNFVSNDSFSIRLFLEHNQVSQMLLDVLETTDARENVLRLIDYLTSTIPRASPLLTPLQKPDVLMKLFKESLTTTSVGCARAGFELILSVHSQHHQLSRESINAVNEAFPLLCDYIKSTTVFNTARVSAVTLFFSVINDVFCPVQTSAEFVTPSCESAKKTKLSDSLDLFHITPAKATVSPSASSPRIEGRPPLPRAVSQDQPLKLNEFSRPNFMKNVEMMMTDGKSQPLTEAIQEEDENIVIVEEEEEEEEEGQEANSELEAIEEVDEADIMPRGMLEAIQESDEEFPQSTESELSLGSIQEVDEETAPVTVTKLEPPPKKKDSVHFTPIVKRNSFDMAALRRAAESQSSTRKFEDHGGISHMRSWSDVQDRRIPSPFPPFPVPDASGFRTPTFKPMESAVPAFFHKRTNTSPESPLLGGSISLSDLFKKVSPDIPDPVYVQARRPSSRPSVRCDSPQIGPLTFSPLDDSPIQTDPQNGKQLSLLELAQHDKRRASLQTLHEDTFGPSIVKQLDLSDSPINNDRPNSTRVREEPLSLVDLAKHSRLSIDDFQRPTSAPIHSPSNSPPYASCMQSQPIFNCYRQRTQPTVTNCSGTLAKSGSNGSIKVPVQLSSPRSPFSSEAKDPEEPDSGRFSLDDGDVGCFAIEEVADEDVQPTETTEVSITQIEEESGCEITLDHDVLVGTVVFLIEQFFAHSSNTFLHNAVIDILGTLFESTSFVPEIITESHMTEKILEMYEHKDPKMSFWGQLHHLSEFIQSCPEVIPESLLEEWNQYIETVYEPAEEIMKHSYGGDFPDLQQIFSEREGRELHPDL